MFGVPIWVWIVIAIGLVLVVVYIVKRVSESDHEPEVGPKSSDANVTSAHVPGRGDVSPTDPSRSADRDGEVDGPRRTDAVREPQAPAVESDPVVTDDSGVATTAFERDDTAARTGEPQRPEARHDDEAHHHTIRDEAVNTDVPITEDADDLRRADELSTQDEDLTDAEPNPAADQNRGERARSGYPQRTESETGVPIASAQEQFDTQHERERVKTEGYSSRVQNTGHSTQASEQHTSAPDNETATSSHDDFDDEFEVPRDEQGRRLDPYGNPVE